MSTEVPDLQYPIGKYESKPFSEAQKSEWIDQIKWLPNQLELAIQSLDEYQLDTPYREDGWTVRQLTHHIADSHMNAYIRFKWGLTEDGCTIKTYDEKKWAELGDIFTVPVNVSITLLHALHRKWVAVMQEIKNEDWVNCTVFHPEKKVQLSLWFLLGMYAWHSQHHVAHINNLKQRNGWLG